MDIGNRPVILYFGNKVCNDQVAEFCSSSLAAFPIEWSLNSNLPPCTVHVDPLFLFLDLQNDPEAQLKQHTHQPVAYIYVCANDLKNYLSEEKAKIALWYQFIKTYNISNWLLVTISDKQRKISLTSSVLHKIKQDFNLTSAHNILDLPKDSKMYAQTWQDLLLKIRQIILQAFTANHASLENTAQAMVKDVGKPTFDFVKYLIIQEKIASLFFSLGLFQQALDCIKTSEQTLSNCLSSASSSDLPEWLQQLKRNTSVNMVSNLDIISTLADSERMERLKRKTADLFDVYGHLLSRQCFFLQAIGNTHLLLHYGVLSLHSLVKNVANLKFDVPPTQLHFWTFLCSMQILNKFRQCCPSFLPPEFSEKLRQKFSISTQCSISNISTDPLPQLDKLSTAKAGSDELDIADGFSTLSHPSKISLSSLNSTGTVFFDSLDLLEEPPMDSLEFGSGAFHLIARVVHSSVVIDYWEHRGRRLPQHQGLRGNSMWAVELWKIACTSIGKLGRHLNLWPYLSNVYSTNDTSNDLEFLKLLKSVKDYTSCNSTSSSIGAQLSLVFSSLKAFNTIYPKLINLCIFFLWFSKRKRNSLHVSLELADYYRDSGLFLQAEVLYHRGTKLFLREAWLFLSTYVLLQLAFCQQVQWRNEKETDSETSVFARYIQTAMILAVTPVSALQSCYEQIEQKGPYFLNLITEKTQVDVVWPAWWPDNWWNESVRLVASQNSRNVFAIQNSSLHVKSLRPFFKCMSIDLENANKKTGKQIIRLHLYLVGTKSFWARVNLKAKLVTDSLWKAFIDAGEHHADASMKFFNIDLGDDTTANTFNQKSVSHSSKSFMRRYFRTSYNDPNPQHNHRTGKTQQTVNAMKRRPASVEFSRSHLNASDRHLLMPNESSQLGLDISADFPDYVVETCSSDQTNLAIDAVVRKRPLGSFSHDFVRNLFRKSELKNGFQIKSQEFVMPNTDSNDCTVQFKNCKIAYSINDSHFELCDNNNDEAMHKSILLQPGNNFILLEAMNPGFYLPGSGCISILSDDISLTPTAIPSLPILFFTWNIEHKSFGSSWTDQHILNKLLPRIDQIWCLYPHAPSTKPKESTHSHSISVVLNSKLPIFMTIRMGSLVFSRLNPDGSPALHISISQTKTKSELPEKCPARYSVTDLTAIDSDSDLSTTQSNSIHLVDAPNESVAEKNSNLFLPNSLLCLYQCLFITPKEASDQFNVIMPSGVLCPIDVNVIYPFCFQVNVTAVQQRLMLISLRVTVSEILCPGTGIVSQSENSEIDNLSPFSSCQVLEFKLCSPSMVVSAIGSTPSILTSSSFVRKQSVVDYSLPETSKMNQHSLYDLIYDNIETEGVLEGKLFDSKCCESTVSCCKPCNFIWLFPFDKFQKLTRPTDKPNTVGVNVNFNFLVNSKFDETALNRITYRCTICTRAS